MRSREGGFDFYLRQSLKNRYFLIPLISPALDSLLSVNHLYFNVLVSIAAIKLVRVLETWLFHFKAGYDPNRMLYAWAACLRVFFASACVTNFRSPTMPATASVCTGCDAKRRPAKAVGVVPPPLPAPVGVVETNKLRASKVKSKVTEE